MTALFFDFDGTLFDSRSDLAATVNHTRRDLGLGDLPLETVLSFVGHGAGYLLEHTIPERTGDEVRALFRRHYAEHCCVDIKPYPGVVATLEILRRRGFGLGINTNKPNYAVAEILKKFDMADFFGPAIVAGGDGFPLKPAPESIRACAARMNHVLTPEDWMVGDAYPDMKCAEAAGVKAALCAFGFGILGDATYTTRLERFEDLLRAVDGA